MSSVLFLAAFDSQLKWCARLRDEFGRRGFDWEVVVPDIRSALSVDQITAAGFTDVRSLPWQHMLQAATQADVVISALSGPQNETLLVDVGDRLRADGCAPVLVTGWVGVIIENATGGYLNRCASDVIAVNSRSDLEQFRTVAGCLGLPADNLLLTGLPLLDSARRPPRDGPIRRVLFADQPTVPQRAEDRHFLYQRLLEYAARHPDREVVLKPRHRLDEDTFHRMRHHPASLLAGRTAPENFMIDYTSVTEQLPYTDLVLTVSSTACLEAIDHGCRVGLILDLGVHEKLGNHVFVSSGLLRTFAQIEADELGCPEDDWLDDYFFPRDRSAAQLIADRAEELLASGERPSRAARNTPISRSTAAFQRAVAGGRQRRLTPRSLTGWRQQLASIGHAVLPPVLVTPTRRLAQRTRILR